MNVCAQRGDGLVALEIARDQRTSRCGPPTEKFMVRSLTVQCAVMSIDYMIKREK